MKGFIFCCFLLVSFCSVNAQFAVDRSSPLHLGAGVVIGAVGGYSANKIFKGDKRWTWAGAVGSALAAGVVKEAIDEADYGGWDNNDIIFTTLGGAISGLALELLMNRRRGRGKPCSCYATSYNPEILYSDWNVNFVSMESRSLTSNIQAQYFLNK